MILPGSRYAGSSVQMVDEVLSIAVRPRSLANSFYFRRYRATESDRTDVLAHKFLGNVADWHVLADANPEAMYPEFAAGTEVRIPYE